MEYAVAPEGIDFHDGTLHYAIAPTKSLQPNFDERYSHKRGRLISGRFPERPDSFPK
jgi:hypothetical protein